MKIAAISGSLRAGSSNTAVLRAAARLAPAGVEVVLFEGIADLPFFNPDFDGDDVPASVGAMRALIGNVDGLLISSPEYARGVAGVLKNALDWLVGSHEFPDKPVALINTSPRATHALAALTLTLETMSARIATEACVNCRCSAAPGTSTASPPILRWRSHCVWRWSALRHSSAARS